MIKFLWNTPTVYLMLETTTSMMDTTSHVIDTVIYTMTQVIRLMTNGMTRVIESSSCFPETFGYSTVPTSMMMSSFWCHSPLMDAVKKLQLS